MKKLLTTIFAISTLIAFSQAPQGISYQGIARNSSGTILANLPIGIKLDLHQGSIGGAVVFSETHTPTTNQFGLFGLGIGSVNTSGFATINWGGGPYFLEVSIDPTGGTSYTPLAGTQQFMSVPYALYAQTSGNASPTPTITINAPNTVSGSAGSYSINVPAQTLSINSNSISISNGNTIVLPATTTYTAGTGINVSGNTISNTAPDQTVTITPAGSASVTGTYPNFTINTPTTQAYTAGNGIDITSGVISNTAAAVTPTIIGTGATTVTSTGNTFTVNTPAPQVYTAGNGIDINSGVISNTATAITPTITSTGIAVVTPTTGNTFNVDVPVPVLSYNNGTNVLTLTQGTTATTATLVGTGTNTTSIVGSGLATVTPTTGSTFTVSVPNPTLSIASGSLSISNGNSVAIPSPSLTINSNSLTINGPGGNTVVLPTASTTSVTQGTNITVAGSAPNYTVSAPAYSITLPGGNVVQITNGVSTSTAPIAATNLTLNGANNNILSAGGNTVTLNTYTAGTGIAISGTAPNYTLSSPNQSLTINSNSISITGGNTITIPTSSTTVITPSTNISVSGTAPNYTISSPSQSLAINSNSLSITGGNTVTIPTSTITGVGTGIATVTTSANNFTVNVSSPSYLPGTGVLSFGTNTVSVLPTLALSGTTLTSGPSTNSVNLSGFNGIYGGSGSIQTGSTTVTVGTNTLTFLSGATMGKSIANFFGGGITGTHLAVGHIGANNATIKLLGSVSTTPVDYGYVSGSTNGVSISGGTSSNGLYATTNAEVGVGTFTTGTGKFVITHTATQADPTMHLRETTGGLNRIKFSNNTVANKFFETASQTNAVDANGAYTVNYFDGSTYKTIFAVTGDKKVNVNNLNTVLASFHVMENATTAGGGIVSEGFARPGQMIIARNNQPALAARTAIVAADEIGKLSFSGYNGAGFNDGAMISVTSTEAFTGSAGGGNMFFRVTPTGTVGTQDLFKLGGDGSVTVNPNYTFSKALLDVKGRLRVDSTLTMAAYNTPPNTSTFNEGRIYFDRPTNKFKVSENGGAYVDLIPGGGSSPWIQGAGIVTQGTLGDKVGIGTNTPNAALEVATNAPSLDGLALNINNASNGSNGLQLLHFGIGNAAYIEVNNSSSAARAIEVLSNGTGIGIRAQLTNTTSTSDVINATNYGRGNAGFFQNINSSNSGKAIEASTNGTGAAFGAATTGSGSAGVFSLNNAANTAIGLDVSSNGGGYSMRSTNTGSGSAGSFEILNAASTQNGLIVQNMGTGAALYASTSNTTSGSAAQFNSNNTNFTTYSTNNGSGGSIFSNGTGGPSLWAVNNSNTSTTIYANNGGTGDVIQAYGTGQRAIYAQSASNGYAAVELENTGTGQVLSAYKSAGATGGIVGSFANNSTANAADVIFVSNAGAGAAVHAVSAATSSVGLWVQGGHLKSTQSAAPTASTVATGISFSGATYTLTNATDVKGSLLAVCTTTSGLSVYASSTISFRVSFNKQYQIVPTVVITPTVDMAGLSYFISSVNASSFVITIKNSSAATISVPSLSFSFNYMVIE